MDDTVDAPTAEHDDIAVAIYTVSQVCGGGAREVADDASQATCAGCASSHGHMAVAAGNDRVQPDLPASGNQAYPDGGVMASFRPCIACVVLEANVCCRAKMAGYRAMCVRAQCP